MILREHWQPEDVIVHLHDSSYLPLVYYAPEADSYLLNNDPDSGFRLRFGNGLDGEYRRRMRWLLGKDACGWWSCRPS